jgi:prolyl-tRNA synthetase
MTHRMSTLFLRTLREDPTDAEVPSHRLLVRAGYVRRTAAGIATWLPLGLRVLDKIAAVVRAEMAAIGAQEVRFPALLPREPYEQSGRAEAYGDLLFQLADRRGARYLLGPTHEEMFALLVRGEVSSYRDLPLILFQIQTKYRDEARPRSGLLRGREFVMKDSYSFDLDDAGLATAYARHRAAYQRIFARVGLRAVPVRAFSGAMGGSRSEEFLAPAAVGEDTYVACAECGYAANTEAVEVGTVAVPAGATGPVEVLDTPDTPTIETLCALLGVPAAATLKNLLVRIDGKIVAVGVPGDREVDLARLEARVEPAAVELLSEADFAARPDLVRGYVGPQGLPSDVPYWADPAVAVGTAWVTGANQAGRHARNVVAGRDFTVAEYLPLATVRTGDPCPRCPGTLSVDRAIEIGHIFELGRKYTDAFGVDVLGPDGAAVRVTMGSYGIGVSRAVAAIAEQHHDEAGLAWPPAVAPYHVQVLALGRGDQAALAERLAADLSAAGLEVLLDDREGLSAGVRFADAELLGLPWTVVVGRAAAGGVVELRDRRTGERAEVPLDGLPAALAARLSTELSAELSAGQSA